MSMAMPVILMGIHHALLAENARPRVQHQVLHDDPWTIPGIA